jgi:hypothetical protein
MHDDTDAGLLAAFRAVFPSRLPDTFDGQRQFIHPDDLLLLYTHTAAPPLKRCGATITPQTERNSSAAGLFALSRPSPKQRNR